MILTAVLMTLIILALLLILYGGEIGVGVADYFERGPLFSALWTIGQVPMAIVFSLLAFALIYYFAPDLKEQKWYWITPGSLVATVLWLAASLAFRIYVVNFGSYNETYGVIGGVMVLMLWLYISGLMILVGQSGQANGPVRGRELDHLAQTELPAARARVAVEDVPAPDQHAH